MDTPAPWHLYLLLCRDGSYYAGISNDVAARFQAHLLGRGARYTRAHPPLAVLASRAYPDRASASRAEYVLKRLPRTRKLAWLQAPAVIEAAAPPGAAREAVAVDAVPADATAIKGARSRRGSRATVA